MSINHFSAAKKLGVEVPGHEITQQLHSQKLKSSLHYIPEESENKKQGVKRRIS